MPSSSFVLLQYQGDIRVCCSFFYSLQFDWTPLHFAAYHGHMNVVRKLITVCQLPSNSKTKVW